MSNLMWSPSQGIAAATAAPGLSSYTQSNCSTSLTASGFRIYRPPNKNPTADGNTMWGGLRIINSTDHSMHEWNGTTDNLFGLIKSHTYMIEFHVSGKSTNTFASYGWTNQMGWGGGGLSPNPSNVLSKSIPSNFNGEIDCYYQFTVSDDIAKVCTSSYSYAVAGKTYLSYNHFMVGYGYSDTGSLGTDIYISDLRMYDITTGNKLNFAKSGLLSANGFLEITNQQASLNAGQEAVGYNFIEI